MYLKELKLNGFKSFADTTQLDLQRGVTAIVGPNGCGKSNIADAIRWVLGEQSAKSLRAGAMQDVIFQGTTHRKPVNLCEVTLVFTDCEDKLGTAYHEVEISRRAIRDGGSEYLLNGKQCRLKDIQRLFLDTGVGQVSYSFMLQGQIDQVLSSNPNERRAIFEEAAGISKYKAQRREALNKLGQVDTNLARVTDVIEEVSRQIGSLKRQASKALRYKRIHHRLTHLDLAFSSYRYQTIGVEVKELSDKQIFLKREVEKLEKELESAESGLSGKRSNRNELNEKLQEAQKEVYELRSLKENAQNKTEFADIRKKDTVERIQEISNELKELERQEQVLADRLAGESKVKQEQMDLFGSSDEKFQEKNEEISEIQQKLGNAETNLSRQKHALMAKEGAIARLRSNVTSLELDLKTFQVRHANLTEEIQVLKDDSGVLKGDLEKLEKTRIARAEDLKKHEAKIEELRKNAQDLLHAFREMQSHIGESDRKIAAVQAQIQVLEGLQSKFEGFSEGARAILQGQLEGVVDSSDYDLFLKQIQVDASYTRSFEILAGSAADGLYLKSDSRIVPIAKKLLIDKMGHASLLVKPRRKSDIKASVDDLPNWLVRASSVVSSKNNDLQAFLTSFLAGSYFCDDLESFLEFWEKNPKFNFSHVVTQAGEWIDSRGVLLVGASKKDKQNATFLARQNQLKKFKAELKKLNEDQEKRRLQADQIQTKIDAADKKIEDQRRLTAEVKEEVTTLVAQREGAQRNFNQNSQLLKNKQSELEKLDRSKSASTERLDKAKAEFEETETDIDNQKKIIAEAETLVVSLREERDQKREAFNETRLEIAEKKQRLELLDRGMDELKEKTKEIESTRVKRLQEKDSLEKQIKTFETDIGIQKKELEGVDKKLEVLIKQLEVDRKSLGEIEQSIETIENGFKSKRESYQKLSSELNKEEVALARKQSRLQFISEEVEREYDKKPDDIDWKIEIWQAGDSLPDRIKVDIEEESPEDFEVEVKRPDPTEEDLTKIESTDWSEMEEEIATLRSKIQSMGPVNLVAIEEYKELKERYEFLKEQSEDLWKSKEQLLQAIDEINTTSQELFAETFAKIRENFKYTFDTLFGGGNSDLKLIDTEDVLESGIEITAQPPGTRLKSLALLSGGQKTMTAVALLFAIYMVKPSPFCVLDEIDAPLDDANIGRFTKMLEQFLDLSQFLIITHNKRTISVADTIYGATMQEKGVSRLVSMRFNKSTGKAEALADTQENEQDGAGI